MYNDILSLNGRIEINPKLLWRVFKGADLTQQGKPPIPFEISRSCFRVHAPNVIIREKGVMKVI